jgi:hypothetical protein
VTFTFLILTRVVDPSVERDVVVHLKQERINRLTVSNHLREELLIDFLFNRDVLLLNCDLVDLVLSLKFQNLHFAVQSEVSVLAPHTPVQQLIEINVTVIAADAHLQHYFLHLVVACVEGQAQGHGQLLEEVIQFLFAQLETPVARLRKVNPSHHEDLKRLREFLNWVVIGHVVHFKLSQNDQNKQVQHHVLDENHKNDVEEWGK